MGKFKNGLVLGALLGIGLTWMNTTKKGRETKENILNAAGDVYGDVKKKVMDSKTWESMTKTKYYKMVDSAVDTYVKDNKMAQSVAKMVKKIVQTQWPKIQQEMKKRMK
ncbi:MAG: YtxH domain-containing protein [Candidatus Magasanikbacteria bacterium]